MPDRSTARMSNSTRRASLSLLAAVSLALGTAAAARAEGAHFTPVFTCTGVTLSYGGFPAGTNTVTEIVTIDRGEKIEKTFSFEGPSGSDTIPISLREGHHELDALVKWNKADGIGGHDHFLAHGINCEPRPGLTVQKLQADERRGPGSIFTTEPLFGTRRQLVRYELVLTNTGNVPLLIGTVADPRCDAGTIAGGTGGPALAPGQSTTYTCSHLLTPGDQAAGLYENVATVQATPEGGGAPLTVESNPVVVELPHDSVGFGCEAVEFSFSNFPDAAGNTVTEIVTIDHGEKLETSFSFNGSSGSNVVPLTLSPGVHKLDARAHWNTNGAHGAHDQVEQGKLRCVDEGTSG